MTATDYAALVERARALANGPVSGTGDPWVPLALLLIPELADAVEALMAEPYCDVCGEAGQALRAPVEVCRDCYDAAAAHFVVPEPLAAAVEAMRADRDALRGLLGDCREYVRCSALISGPGGSRETTLARIDAAIGERK